MTHGILASRSIPENQLPNLEGFISFGLFYESKHNCPPGTYHAEGLEKYIRENNEEPFGKNYECTGPQSLLQLADKLTEMLASATCNVIVCKRAFPKEVEGLSILTENYNAYEIFVREGSYANFAV